MKHTQNFDSINSQWVFLKAAIGDMSQPTLNMQITLTKGYDTHYTQSVVKGVKYYATSCGKKGYVHQLISELHELGDTVDKQIVKKDLTSELLRMRDGE